MALNLGDLRNEKRQCFAWVKSSGAQKPKIFGVITKPELKIENTSLGIRAHSALAIACRGRAPRRSEPGRQRVKERIYNILQTPAN